MRLLVKYNLLIALLVLASLLLVSVALAQPNAYDLSWWTVASGGRGSGNNYILDGTAGQPATTLSGGVYTVIGGFESRSAAGPINMHVYLPLVGH